jgi:hypothetical protein
MHQQTNLALEYLLLYLSQFDNTRNWILFNIFINLSRIDLTDRVEVSVCLLTVLMSSRKITILKH